MRHASVYTCVSMIACMSLYICVCQCILRQLFGRSQLTIVFVMAADHVGAREKLPLKQQRVEEESPVVAPPVAKSENPASPITCAKSASPVLPPPGVEVDTGRTLMAPGVTSALKDLDHMSGAPVKVKQENAMDRKTVNAMRSKFYRGLEQNGARSERVEKASAQLAARLKGDKRGLGYWFKIFCETGSTWAQLDLSVKRIDFNKTHGHKNRKWLTRDRVEAIYKSPAVVDAMIEFAKQDTSLWRVNPNCPTCEEANEYRVLIDDEVSHDNESSEQTVLQGSGRLSNQAAAILADDSSTSFAMAPPLVPRVSPMSSVPTRSPCDPANFAGPPPPVPTAACPAAPSAAIYAATATASALATVAPSASSPVAHAKLQAYANKMHLKEQEKTQKAQDRKIDKERKLKELAIKREAEKKAKDAQKLLASTKAAKWAEGLSKDIGKAEELERGVDQSSLGESMKSDYKAK